MEKQYITAFTFLDYTLRIAELSKQGYEVEAVTLAFPNSFHATLTLSQEELIEQLEEKPKRKAVK